MRPAVLVAVGFLLSSLPLAGAEEPPDEWKVEDRAEDTECEGQRVGLFPHLDIVRVTIDEETPESLRVNVFLRDLVVDPNAEGPSEAAYMDLEFETDDGGAQYHISLVIDGVTGASPPFAARSVEGAYLRLIIGGASQQDQRFAVVLDDPANAVRLTIPKMSLLGLNPSYAPPRPEAKSLSLDVGDAFLFKEITIFGFYACTFEDVVEDLGDPYTLRAGFANRRLRLFALDLASSLPVVPGQNQSVRFAIVNHAETKQLVRLTYALAGDDAALFTVYGPPSVLMPAATQRNYSFAVNVSAAAPDTTRATLRVEATNLQGDLGSLTLSMRPTPYLNPEKHVVYLLARPWDQDLPCGRYFIFWMSCPHGFLSPLANHPNASSEGRISPDSTGSTGSFYLELADPLPSPVAVASKGRIALDLTVTSLTPLGSVNVHATLEARVPKEPRSRTILDATKPEEFDEASHAFAITGFSRLNASASVLPRGTTLRLVLRLELDMSSVNEQVSSSMKIVPVESKITLPLVPLPEDVLEVAQRSPFQISLLDDKDEFVNPGKSRVFRFNVLNQDNATHRLLVGARLNASEGWKGELLPGDLFELKGGESVTLGYKLQSPETAKEGEVATVRLEARDDTGALTHRIVKAWATQVPMPDEGATYTPDPEAQAAQVPTAPDETPGPGSSLGLLAAVLGLLGRRLRTGTRAPKA